MSRQQRVAAADERLPDEWWSTTPDGRRVRVQVYKAGTGQERRFYWHLKSRNGRIVGDGGQGYHERRGAIRAARHLHPDLEPAD